MKIVEMVEATQSLAEFARGAGEGPVVVTEAGRPVAVLLPIENADLETVSLSSNPRFIELIERSRARQREEGDLSSQDVRRQLGIL